MRACAQTARSAPIPTPPPHCLTASARRRAGSFAQASQRCQHAQRRRYVANPPAPQRTQAARCIAFDRMLWGCVRASFANASHVGLYTSARRLGGLALQVLSSSPMLLIRRSSSSSSSSTSSRRVSLHPPTLPTGAVAAARRARMTPPPVSPRASHPQRHRHPLPTSQGCRARGLCRTISRCSRASKL